MLFGSSFRSLWKNKIKNKTTKKKKKKKKQRGATKRRNKESVAVVQERFQGSFFFFFYRLIFDSPAICWIPLKAPRLPEEVACWSNWWQERKKEREGESEREEEEGETRERKKEETKWAARRQKAEHMSIQCYAERAKLVMSGLAMRFFFASVLDE